jgi:hypothetical protein
MAWPPAVAGTMVDWFGADQEESPAAIEARAARLAELAGRAAAILPPGDGWKADWETDFDVDGDGRPERFLRAHRTIGSTGKGDCPAGESALVVSWGGRWVTPRMSPDMDPNWEGWRHAEGGEPPMLADRQIGASMEIVAAVDLDGDGRRELVIGGWTYGPCDRDQGRWALVQFGPGRAAVVARWNECGNPLPGASVGGAAR